MEPELNVLLEKIRKTFTVEFEPLGIDGATFEFLDIKNMKSLLDKMIAGHAIENPLVDLPLWAKLWPGSLILGRFLRKFETQGKSLLEIGCGMGTLGLVASQYGLSKIVLTDINEQALEFAKANALRNNLQELIEIKRLDITKSGKLDGSFNFIAASEILYLDALHRPLVSLLKKHLAPAGKALFCTDMARVKPRFKKLASREFKIQEGHIAIKGEENRLFEILVLEKA